MMTTMSREIFIFGFMVRRRKKKKKKLINVGDPFPVVMVQKEGCFSSVLFFLSSSASSGDSCRRHHHDRRHHHSLLLILLLLLLLHFLPQTTSVSLHLTPPFPSTEILTVITYLTNRPTHRPIEPTNQPTNHSTKTDATKREAT